MPGAEQFSALGGELFTRHRECQFQGLQGLIEIVLMFCGHESV